MPTDAATTALVLIEFQNDFASEGGSFYPAVGPVIEQTGMLEHAAALLDAARESGVLVIHAPLSFEKGHPEIDDDAFGILKTVKDSASFEAASWGAEIVDEVAPAPADVILEGKRGLDAFATTNIDFILRSSNIDTVAFAGFLTNACIESTARSAYEKGYDVVTLTDCTAAASIEAHTTTIANNFPTFSRPMGHQEFIRELGVAEPQAA